MISQLEGGVEVWTLICDPSSVADASLWSDERSLSRDVALTVLNRYCVCGQECSLIYAHGHDKPRVHHCCDLDYSVSHSNGHCVVAVARSAIVGVDIEVPRAEFEWESLIDRAFSKRERAWILSNENLNDACWRLWTMKEASLKATGDGLRGLKKVDFGYGEIASYVSVHSADGRHVLNVECFSFGDVYGSVAYTHFGNARFYSLDRYRM